VVQGVGDVKSIRCDTSDTLLQQTWASKRGVYLELGKRVNAAVPCANDRVLDGLASTGKKKFDIKVIWYDASMDETYNQTLTGQMLVGVEKE
jgi:hypothetical protein